MRPSIFARTSMLTLSQNICVHCRHGIHAHADYVSPVVHIYPPTQCIAYVQKCCMCEIWLCNHILTNNLHHSAEPWTVLDYSPDNNGASYSPATISFSNNTINDPYMPGSTSLSSANPDIVTQFSHDANLMLTAMVSILSPSPHGAFSPSSDMESVPFALTSISSPSSSMSSATYSSHEYFVRHPDQFMNNSAHQPHRDAVHEGVEYHGYSNVSYSATPGSSADIWSGSFA
ncbi:hypothetical protein EDD18DRAFT_1099799 [Armillaria luteobubalina]|uniref:Uncharacterized protein n=1 Tax=Armillaria luteobubalina TaxID=153913 RepID=A0AA39TX17_9AGAR|nr:hypothetical protein EDD18DRAFT_1099799 [Armillaria luteobubalina]